MGGGEVSYEACRWAGAVALESPAGSQRLHGSRCFIGEHAENPAAPSAQMLPETGAPGAPPDVRSEQGGLESFLWSRSDTRPRGSTSPTAFESRVIFEVVLCWECKQFRSLPWGEGGTWSNEEAWVQCPP